jgi:hypothetical protein
MRRELSVLYSRFCKYQLHPLDLFHTMNHGSRSINSNQLSLHKCIRMLLSIYFLLELTCAINPGFEKYNIKKYLDNTDPSNWFLSTTYLCCPIYLLHENGK